MVCTLLDVVLWCTVKISEDNYADTQAFSLWNSASCSPLSLLLVSLPALQLPLASAFHGLCFQLLHEPAFAKISRPGLARGSQPSSRTGRVRMLCACLLLKINAVCERIWQHWQQESSFIERLCIQCTKYSQRRGGTWFPLVQGGTMPLHFQTHSTWPQVHKHIASVIAAAQKRRISSLVYSVAGTRFITGVIPLISPQSHLGSLWDFEGYINAAGCCAHRLSRALAFWCGRNSSQNTALRILK